MDDATMTNATNANKQGNRFDVATLPNQEAIVHFKDKVLLDSSSYLDVLAHEHAIAFVVAGMADADLLAETKAAIQSALDSGSDFNAFKRRLKPYLTAKGWLPKDSKTASRRLRLIYHTNLHTAYAAGQWQRIQKTKEFLPYLQYMPSVSENPRLSHKRYYDLVRPVDDAIWASIFPPNGFGCFLGDVQIQGDLQSAMVKWYEGVAVEFTTKSGRNITVTANHPILTARGWVRADGLTISDDVLCYDLPINTVNVDVLSGQIHHNQTEPTAKNLFKAFFNQTFAFTGTTAFKFNSDVANGEIHIDVINDGLVLHISADVLQGVQKFELIRGDDGRFTSYSNTVGSSDIAVIINDFIGSQNAEDVATTAIKAFCQSTLAYFGCGVQMNNFSFQFVISGTTDRPSLSTLPFNATNRLFDTLPTDNTGTAHISQDDTVLTELASNAFTTDFGLFGYLIDTHASIVFADPVINVRQFSFSGHVYDFQSSESIVSANGIIAHNCKCWVKQLTKRQAEKVGISDAVSLPTEQIHNQRRNVTVTTPKGVEPSFAHNHGDRLSALLKIAETKHGGAFVDKLKAKLNAFMLDLVQQPDFNRAVPTVLDGKFADKFLALQRLVTEHQGNRKNSMVLRKSHSTGEVWAVATISPEVGQLLQTKTHIVWLSDDTVIKMLAHHPEQVSMALFQDVHLMLKNATLILKESDTHVSYFRVEEKLYKASIKVTKDRRELYLLTVFETNQKEFDRMAKKTEKVIFDNRNR